MTPSFAAEARRTEGEEDGGGWQGVRKRTSATQPVWPRKERRREEEEEEEEEGLHGRAWVWKMAIRPCFPAAAKSEEDIGEGREEGEEVEEEEEEGWRCRV